MTLTTTSLYQDKKGSNVVLNTTPKKQRKSSVTFDLPPTPNNEEEEEDNTLLSPCTATTVTSPTIDICAQIVPDTMLVALFDRSSEMKGLVSHNKIFFNQLKSHLDNKWSRFENTLYCDRSKMPDIEWIKRISKALQGVPSLLERFKELVGYMGDSETTQEDDNDDDATSTGDSEYFSTVDISDIRHLDKNKRITQESYPQFYINCQQFMNEKEFKEFISTLLNTTLSNEIWESKIYKQLNNWPNLLEQLQEIIAYEIQV